MRAFRILFRKELKGFFQNPFGWIVLAFVIIMQGISLSMAMKGFRTGGSNSSLVYAMCHTPLFWFYFLFIFPLITMRLFSDEEKSGTLETLLTAPVRTWQVVLSKFCAAYVFYIVLWIPSYFQLQLFSWSTGLPPAWTNGGLIGTYSIALLMGAAFTAVGCLASSLTSSQIIAGITTICGLLIIYFLGFVTVIWGDGFPGAALFRYISIQQHLHYFASGVMDTRPVVFHLSLTAFLLFMTYQVVDYRRWKH
ncbi:MAG: ABC transporter permease [Luteolibacter sp.]